MLRITKPSLQSDLISADEVCRLIAEFRGDQRSISQSTLYRGISNGLFPPPFKLSPKVARWSQKEVESSLRAQLKLQATARAARVNHEDR